ncbi:MAG: 50S ribosome-binding GTPase [Synergistaceae bacterium]|nr:50S ribosome-binding GTPase [Synergistaceae bacterium]
MNSEYSREVEKLSSAFSETVSNSGAFTQEEVSSFNNEISNHVLPLLNAPKPKILVYGIYNGGKSTLINAIIGREVASVANRPETHKITPYDTGKYVLVDSPGIDAPKEDEQMADDQIKKCHVILFVVSSKGGFESEKNYRKMWDLMQKDIPFIIVLNDRGAPSNEAEQHTLELNGMKSKIIANLMKVSGRNDVERKYEVITVNALRAWRGVSENKPGFTVNSRISDLTSRIDQLLESKEVLKMYLAPLSALEGEINRAEELLTARRVTADFARRRATLQQKVSELQSSMENAARYTASRHTEEIYHSLLGEGGRKIEDINEEISHELEEKYKISVSPILAYIQKSFNDINVTADESGVKFTGNTEELQPYSRKDDESSNIPLPSYSDNNSSEGFDLGNIAKAAATGAALGSVVPIPIISTTSGALIAGGLELGRQIIKQLLGGDKDREEFERRQREVEAYNRMQAQLIEEDKRRRQDASTAANSIVNSAVKQLRAGYSELIERTFSNVIQFIDSAAARNSASNAAIDKTMNSLSGLKANIHNLRQKIA